MNIEQVYADELASLKDRYNAASARIGDSVYNVVVNLMMGNQSPVVIQAVRRTHEQRVAQGKPVPANAEEFRDFLSDVMQNGLEGLPLAQGKRMLVQSVIHVLIFIADGWPLDQRLFHPLPLGDFPPGPPPQPGRQVAAPMDGGKRRKRTRRRRTRRRNYFL